MKRNKEDSRIINHCCNQRVKELKRASLLQRLLRGQLIEVLLPNPGNQAVGRYLILSYFYGFLILRSEQVAGTYSVARRQVEDSQRVYELYICVYMYKYVYVHVYAHV